MRDSNHSEFDPLTCPLEGMQLIEASAGTGKTHTIGSLFLRLLLEKQLDIGEILVVTFTQAATEELKERIRTRIKEALEAFLGKRAADEFLEALGKRIISRNLATALLESALRRFDEASIYTIHGFCARVLTDHAFEMGEGFDVRLITQEEHLYERLAYDFWRNKLYTAPPEFTSFAVSRKFIPPFLTQLLKDLVTWPDLKILPEDNFPGLPDLVALRKKFLEMKRSWHTCKEDVRQLLLGPELSGNRYGSLKKDKQGFSRREALISVMFAQMNQWLARPWPLLPIFPQFEKFTSGYVSKSVKKGKGCPHHEFFELAQVVYELSIKIQEQMDAYLLGLKVEFANTAREELEKEKWDQNLRGYQDLILRTVKALKGNRVSKVVASLHKRYKAALIDEFHDTDSAQYFIFTSLFGHDSRPLLLVGDPKQAIYAFRGADIFAYLRATSEVNKRYTLSTNWRSERSLIDAVNTLFGLRQRPFVFEEIDYVRAVPTSKKNIHPLEISGYRVAPLQFWYLERDPEAHESGPISKTRARALLARAVACEVSRLIRLGRAGSAIIGENPVKEKDIAVLVRTNEEAFIVQQELRAFNIHSVLSTGENVFDTPQAWEMEQVAAAIATPEDPYLVRAALATEIFGMDAMELLRLEQDNSKWEETILRFRQYRLVWEKSGFLAMFYRLLDRERTFEKLLRFPGGERKISNLLQLSELIQEVTLEQSLSINGAVAWLARQRDPDVPRSQEHQLRLDSDEEAVKILTIHKSKGLEFPIVFCPYAWGGSDTKKQEVRFHLPDNSGKFVYDMGSSEIETHWALAAREELAENIRLLYVALTRAKSACYVAWGDINQTDTSAFAYLLCGPEQFSEENVVEETRRLYGEAKERGIRERLIELQTLSNGAIEVSEPPLQGQRVAPFERDTKTFVVRQFRGHLASDWSVSSFSSLISDSDEDTDLADHDAVYLTEEETERVHGHTMVNRPLGIFDFPRGPRAGRFLHKIMEDVDFTWNDREKYIELIQRRLIEFGYDLVWTDVIYQMLHSVINARLESSDCGPRLCKIPMSRRLNEVEFYFPLSPISPHSLAELFGNLKLSHSFSGIPEKIGALKFSPTKGFMKGFIDMVFEWNDRYYLVDWKSNFLGASIEDYGQESLEEEMVRHLYVLQYHLYTIALDQYLRKRLSGYRYDEHFGGVYYIFLRGVSLERSPKFGIFKARPSGPMIEQMRNHLIETPQHKGQK